MKYPKTERGKMEAVVNKLGGMEGVDRFLFGELTVKASDLLRQITTVLVNGANKFVVKNVLKEANVGWTGDNFKKLFLDKVEEDVEDAALVVHRLEKDSLDTPIMVELGNRVETKLAHFFGLLEKQSKGEDGPLLINGCANVAYIIGNDGNFWAVSSHWHSGDRCWNVRANSIEYPVRWDAGSQVLSRDL